MKTYYEDEQVTLHLDTDSGCLAVLPTLADASVDAVVCDPPYELGFMGRAWDASGIAYNVDMWAECLRVLKPGGHLAAFGGTRTYHRMTCAIEDAGFEVRDSLHWINGSGFPKSLDVSTAIDRAAGAERDVVGERAWTNARMSAGQGVSGLRQAGGFAGEYERERVVVPVTAPATADAARWSGWGTALKPAHEPIVLARKPFAGTVAGNVLAHGTGALNIDGCRTAHNEPPGRPARGMHGKRAGIMGESVERFRETTAASTAGRWPSNVVLTHPPLLDDQGEPIGDACADGCVPGCPVADMDRQSGVSVSSGRTRNNRISIGGKGAYSGGAEVATTGHDDAGGASRFFPVFRYEAKAPASERPKLPDGTAHPTVKPVALMRWLVRLVTPPGGLVLDPFAGTGTTLEAAALEDMRAVGIERDEPHAELCRIRLAKPRALGLFSEPA